MPDTSTRFGLQRQTTQQRVAVSSPSSVPRIQYSTGMGKVLQDFSFDLFRASGSIEAELDEQAKAEASVEGATDGATGNFETRDYTTIRNRAYNQAGIETFVSTLETRSITAMAEITRQFENDPAGLQVALASYRDGVAKEISEISPGAAATYRQRQTMRSVPAVEAARDNAFRLSQDQADAALIANQVALSAELKAHSADLFSENPARSQAAAASVGMIGEQLMRVYSATDATTGRPLYTARQRAKANGAFRDQVFTTAAMSWFEAQENKSQAYIDFASGDFKIDLSVLPASVDIIDGTLGKVRDKPISGDVGDKLSTAVAATDPTLSVMVVSGGQDEIGSGGKRTGSTRHDHGEAGDIVLMRDGKPIRPDDDPELYARFLENAAASGFTGIGHYPWGVHVGGGTVSEWGPDTTAGSLDPTFGAAIARGRANPIDTKGGTRSMNAQDILSPAALNSLDSEMRSVITFSNQQADRAARAEAAALKTDQETAAFDMTVRLHNGGEDGPSGEPIPPLTLNSIAAGVESRRITASTGQALVKAMAVEPAKVSDQDVYTDLLAKLYSGENIYNEALSLSDQLSPSDLTSLLSKNQSQNVLGEGTLSKSQQFQFSTLKDLLTPDGLMATIDPSAERRKADALDEFMLRVGEGEPARDVANDLKERATRDFESITNSKLDAMVKPRFSVADGKRINVQASAVSLQKALERDQISQSSYDRQVSLLRQWADLQGRAE